jgi:hypothetical protein
MKFKVNSREMARIMVPAVEIATKNCVKEFDTANLITIKAEKDRLLLNAYGGTASIISVLSNDIFQSLEYSCSEEGSATVKALNLRDSLTTQDPGIVSISNSNNELVVILEGVKDSRRAMPMLDKEVVPPNIGQEYTENITIDRQSFITGVGEVLWAPAKEEKMITYMCMLMETIKAENTVRFSAGSGGRFAIKSIKYTGNNEGIFKTDKDVRIIFPKNNLSNIHKVASVLDDEMITIKKSVQDSSRGIPEQIIIEGHGNTLCLFGLDSYQKYPDLSTVIDYSYPNRIYSDLEGWSNAVGGVEMTRRDHISNIHNTEVVFNSDEEKFVVTPQTAHSCVTPVPIVDPNDCIAKGDKIWFKCNSEYLTEMVQRAGKTGRVKISFESQEILKDIPDDEPKIMKPILVSFSEKSNEAKETIENFYMLFSVSLK